MESELTPKDRQVMFLVSMIWRDVMSLMLLKSVIVFVLAIISVVLFFLWAESFRRYERDEGFIPVWLFEHFWLLLAGSLVAPGVLGFLVGGWTGLFAGLFLGRMSIDGAQYLGYRLAEVDEE